MIFSLVIIWHILRMVQPHLWGVTPFLEDIPITSVTLLVAFVLLIIFKKNLIINYQVIFLVLLLPVIVVSGLLNGWLGGGVTDMTEFVVKSLLPFFLYINLLDTQKRLETFMMLNLLAALVMLSNGYSQINSDLDIGLGWAGSILSQGTRITYIGELNDPNDLGGFFVLCLPFAMYHLLYSNYFRKLFGIVCVGLLLSGVYLTNSRGTLVAVFVITGIYIYQRYGRSKFMFLSLLSSPIVVFVLSKFRAIEIESSAMGRLDAWASGFEFLKEGPLFGIGMGNFTDNAGITAHNSFVLIMGELGLIGYSLWFSFVSLTFFMSFKLYLWFKNYIDEKEITFETNSALVKAYRINIIALYSMVGYFTTSLFLSRTYTFITYLVCAFVIATTNNLSKFTEKESKIYGDKEVQKMFVYSFCSIIAMNIVLKVLI